MDGLLKTETIRITPAILRMVAEIDEFKGAWTALGRLAPERLDRLRRLATVESIGSSTRIEGARLSDQDVDKLLSNIDFTALASWDEEEVAGYAAAMETVFAGFDAIGLTENHIGQLHRDLLQYSAKDDRHRGEYKKLENHVEAFGTDGESLGIMLETAEPPRTAMLFSTGCRDSRHPSRRLRRGSPASCIRLGGGRPWRYTGRDPGVTGRYGSRSARSHRTLRIRSPSQRHSRRLLPRPGSQGRQGRYWIGACPHPDRKAAPPQSGLRSQCSRRSRRGAAGPAARAQACRARSTRP